MSAKFFAEKGFIEDEQGATQKFHTKEGLALQVKVLQQLKYLGGRLHRDGSVSEEVAARIDAAQIAWFAMRGLWQSPLLQIKVQVPYCQVWKHLFSQMRKCTNWKGNSAST